MIDPILPIRRQPRRKLLGACLAAALCLATPLAATAATTWTVDSCNEANTGSGTTGSLRYAAANAANGDTIDLSSLTCSTISLTTGAVVFAQADITLNGPGKDALTIEGSNDRVFRHDGLGGTLAVNNLTVANGYLHPASQVAAQGGCVFSSGKLALSHVGVHSCRAVSHDAAARGGGIYAKTGILAKYSDITGNTATTSGNTAYVNGGGGGIFTYGYAALASSTVSGNAAQTGAGGGVRAFGDSVTIASTVSGNIAQWGGGIFERSASSSPTNTFALLNSTVSGNQALNVVGGAWTNAGTIHVYNSTVAFNTAGSATGPGGITSKHYSAAFTIDDGGAWYTDIDHYEFKKVTLQSSVFSNNTSGTATPVADDFGIVRFSNLELVPISGQNNIAFGIADPFLGLRIDIVAQGVCAQLQPLRNNGGPTQTHALFRGSPAIDAGNTSAQGLSPFDQRGSPFARVSGAQADIGAYERQQGDQLFDDGFDAPPTCPG